MAFCDFRKEDDVKKIIVLGLTTLTFAFGAVVSADSDAEKASQINAMEKAKAHARIANRLNSQSLQNMQAKKEEKEQAARQAAQEERMAALKASADSADLDTSQGRLAYVTYVGELARDIAGRHDLYASVMTAQLLLESGFGRSGLSAKYNNYFGIKGAYKGQSVDLATQEDNGYGSKYTITDGFRVYPSMAASMEDYANLLNTPLYSGVRKSATSNYREASWALTGLYATDTGYNRQLNSLIERYDLTQYD